MDYRLTCTIQSGGIFDVIIYRFNEKKFSIGNFMNTTKNDITKTKNSRHLTHCRLSREPWLVKIIRTVAISFQVVQLYTCNAQEAIILNMKSIVITGCNRGLGLGLIRRLADQSNPPQNIVATCRNLDKAKVSLFFKTLKLLTCWRHF